jgi:hypothetical protein
MNHPRSAFGASPSRGRHQRPGKAGSAVALDRMTFRMERISPEDGDVKCR